MRSLRFRHTGPAVTLANRKHKAISELLYTIACDTCSSFSTYELTLMNHSTLPGKRAIPEAGHLNDLKLAASKMLGAKRRAFQAEMAVKYCAGSPRQAEVLFGWNRDAVELGLHEKRTGYCLSQCAIGHRWRQALGGEAPGRGQCPVGLGARPFPTGSDLPHRAVFYPTEREGSPQAVARPGLCGRGAALCEHHGRSTQPKRLPAAPGGQGQTPKKKSRKPMPSSPTSRKRTSPAMQRRSCD
jgi:hypothetical protein